MRILYFTVLLLYLTASPTACLAETGAPFLDPRAEKLIREIEVRKSLPISDERWKFTNGPWAEYLDRYLKEGPDSADLVILAKAREEGDCSKMLSLAQNSFLQRFPYLASAHLKEHVRDYFKWTFIYEIPIFSYCRAKAELALAFDLSERDELRIFPFYALWAKKLSASRFGPRSEDTPYNQARNTLCSAFSTLMRSALQDRYIPAIRDLIHYAGMPRLIVLTPEQEYALFKVAGSSGLYDPQVDGLWLPSRAGIDLRTREEIDRILAGKRRRMLLKRILYLYWPCSAPRIDPFLKMQHRKDK